MKASDEIMELKEPGCDSELFKSGYRLARGDASLIAHRHDLTARTMAEALESIDLNDERVAGILGDDTVFLIRYALKAYREQQSK